MSGPIPELAAPFWLLALALLPLLAAARHRRWFERWQRRRVVPVSRLPVSRLPVSRLPVSHLPDGLRSDGPRSVDAGADGRPRGAQPAKKSGGGRWRLHLTFYLRLAALALLIVALARPRLGYAWEEAKSEGIDIQIALDVSASMASRPMADDGGDGDSRLAIARRVVQRFIRGRPADRLGLTLFAGAAITRSPLTADRLALLRMVDEVDTGRLPDGTAIGIALTGAAGRLAASDAPSRVIVLVTDGASNAGEIDPLTAAAVCSGYGIRVYTIGVGRLSGASGGDLARTGGDRAAAPAQVPAQMAAQVDEELMAEIAARTGGRFYRADEASALARIFAEIDRLERVPVTIERRLVHRELFQPVAGTGLALLLLPLLTTAAGWSVEP